VDLEGNVVAINTAIIPYAQGIGFAIPINAARKCTMEMVQEGISVRPWLGIVGLGLNQEIAEYYGLPLVHGVLITKVADGSPAQGAGMAMGDVILRVGGIEIGSIEDLLSEIHRRKVGDMVGVSVWRRGVERLFEVVLSRSPEGG
jgi:S1-C subfamily serine protease